MDLDEEKIYACKWQECENNKDWFYIDCIKRKVNVWKLAKKNNMSMVQIFLSCPYCGGRVVMK